MVAMNTKSINPDAGGRASTIGVNSMDAKRKTMAASNVRWTRPQSMAIVREYMKLSAMKRAGKLARGVQADRARDLLALVNSCGPNRATYRADGKLRNDWWNRKMQNISYCLSDAPGQLNRPEFICPGFEPLAHSTTDSSNPEYDAYMVATLESEIAIVDAARKVEGSK